MTTVQPPRPRRAGLVAALLLSLFGAPPVAPVGATIRDRWQRRAPKGRHRTRKVRGPFTQKMLAGDPRPVTGHRMTEWKRERFDLAGHPHVQAEPEANS